MNINDVTVRILADTEVFDAAADRVASRLAELKAEAQAIKDCVPGLALEVDAVIDSIERMARTEV